MLKITWKEYLNDINTLIKKIEDSEFIPEMIFTFPRGGYIPSTILSHHFDNHNIKIVIDTDEFCNYINSDYKILILDDISDTGKTFLDLELNHLHGNIRFASLYRKEGSLFKPHFIVKDNLLDNEWIVFPYEKEPDDEQKEILNHLEK